MQRSEADAVEGEGFGLRCGLGGGGGGQAVDELIAERALVASAGTGGVVSIAGGAGAWMEILREGKALADEGGPHGLGLIRRERAVFFEERAIGLNGEGQLADPPDQKRVNSAADNSQHE